MMPRTSSPGPLSLDCGSQSLNVFATVGCDSVEEFRQCLHGLELRFDGAELSWLEEGSPHG